MMDNHTEIRDRIEDQTQFSVKGDAEKLEVYNEEDTLLWTIEESGFLHKYQLSPTENIDAPFSSVGSDRISDILEKITKVDT